MCTSFIWYIGGKLKLKDFIFYHIYWMCNFRSFSFQRHINGMKAKSLTALDNDHYFTLVVNLPIKEMDIFDFFSYWRMNIPFNSDRLSRNFWKKTTLGHLLCLKIGSSLRRKMTICSNQTDNGLLIKFYLKIWEITFKLMASGQCMSRFMCEISQIWRNLIFRARLLILANNNNQRKNTHLWPIIFPYRSVMVGI